LGQNNCVDAYKSLNLVNTALNLVNPKDVDFLFLGQDKANTTLKLFLGQAPELKKQTTAIQQKIRPTINPNGYANCTIS
jgi:hypothetical protein